MKNIFLAVFAFLGISVCIASNHDSKNDLGKKINLATSMVPPTISAPPDDTLDVMHKVGECYGGGVVYWINPDPAAPVGRRGLIVALKDATNSVSDKFALMTSTTFAPPGLLRKNFTGLQNTEILYNAGSPAATAARANNGDTSKYTCNYCTDWHIPSQEELMLLYAQLKIHEDTMNYLFKSCGGISPLPNDLSQYKSYWSSSVRYSTSSSPTMYGWNVVFSDGSLDEGTGTDGTVYSSIQFNSPLFIRAVRAF